MNKENFYMYKNDITNKMKKYTDEKEYNLIENLVNGLSEKILNLKEEYVFKMIKMFGCYSTDTTDILNYFVGRDMYLKSFNGHNCEKVAIADIKTDDILAHFTITTEYSENGATIKVSEIIKL